MNQPVPPPNHSDGDSKPNGGTATERMEPPPSAAPNEPSAASTPSSADTESASGGPDEPQPHPEALAGWEEPQPEIGESAPRSGERSDEPRASTSGPRSEAPRPSGEQYRAEGPGESRPGGEHYRAEGPQEPRRRHPMEEHLFSKRTWLRFVFIVLFAVAWWVTEFILTVVVVIQCLWALFTGEANEKLRGFGQSLSRYAYQIFRYMTFNSDERPFPFDLDWPPSESDR